jgi:hypothetical protein
MRNKGRVHSLASGTNPSIHARRYSVRKDAILLLDERNKRVIDYEDAVARLMEVPLFRECSHTVRVFIVCNLEESSNCSETLERIQRATEALEKAEKTASLNQ